MDTIIQQFKQKFPEIYPVEADNNRYHAYSVLHYFGTYCAHHFEDEKTKEILNTVNNIYQRRSLFNCNAIENEFFYALADQLGVDNLMKHLQKIPENLWPVYIKVLIENQQNNLL